MFLNSLSFQNGNKVKEKPAPAMVGGGLGAGDHSPGFARRLGGDMPPPPGGEDPQPPAWRSGCALLALVVPGSDNTNTQSFIITQLQ